MKKFVALGLVLICCIAFGRMLIDIVGSRPEKKSVCASSDYECNYEQYMSDISRKPPSFVRAEMVAIHTNHALQSNLGKIQSLPDYEATSMLRVINAYPQSVKRQLCQNPTFIMDLKRRGEDISSPYQKQEFNRLSNQVGCS